jgi:LmbE family N-acetylglucosaminyl deacetylase
MRLGGTPEDLRVVLCLGAHCDDIEIGCGETLLRLPEGHPGLSVYWVVFSLTPQRAEEARLRICRLPGRCRREAHHL